MNNIRNFSIIAHVNHGKSTLSDRIIQICGGLSEREMGNQILDSMDLERERGITIKAQNVTLNYKSISGKNYQLNFIDTPGHVDFSYEVSRSLSACEGALLIVDAKKGVEAQTLANFNMAIEMGIKIIPVLNKIDLLISNPNSVIKEIKDIITGIDTSDVILCSAKNGTGIIKILERLICDIPPPKGSLHSPLQALIIDSWFDNYLGVVSLVRVKNGIIKKGEKIKIMSTNQTYVVDRLGIFTPKKIDRTELKCGEVGWIVCSIRNIFGSPIGDTITGEKNSTEKLLPGFKKIKPQVYVSLFPINSNDYKLCHNALCKLNLNDSSFSYEIEKSSVLGLGFRCGFLGLLHMEIIRERLEREYGLDFITTAPSVIYKIKTTNNKTIYINNPFQLPPINEIDEFREPIAEYHILLPKEHVGDVISLCVKKRGVQTNMIYHRKQVSLIYEIPMAEVMLDFFNCLKSISHGYASVDYKFKRFQVSKVSRIDILINGERIDAFSSIVHSENAIYRSHNLVKKIKDLIPRQQFDIIIQAAIGSRIIARSIVKQFRKNVLEKCHGGDISRKKKLLKKQKKGKKRMKKLGNIELPKEIFLAFLNINSQ